MTAAQAREIEKLQRLIERLESENQRKSEIISVLVDKIERLKARER